jgi:GNAT superfamily N-acetyltransferase
MTIEIREVEPDALDRYAMVSIAFEVRALLRLELVDGGLGGIALHEEAVRTPYLKDYDAYGEGRPQDWPHEFDVTNWGFLLATDADRPVGAAAIAYDTPGVHMLAGRRDLGVLWDVRVNPAFRGRGIGRALFQRAADWCRARGCRRMKIETQNVNVEACRFYRRQGCELGEINRFAYVGVPHVAHEVMLIWYLDLTAPGPQHPA